MGVTGTVKKVAAKVREKRGDGELVSTMVGAIILVVVFAIIITLLPLFNAKQRLNSYSTELARVVELRGRTDGLDAFIEQLNNSFGLAPTVVFDTDYIGTTKSIQLGTAFEATVTIQLRLKLSDYFDIPVTLTSKAVGRSEYYHKSTS